MGETRLGSWETLESRELFADPPWIRLSVERVRLSTGKIVENFYQIQAPEYAIVVAYTVD